MTSTPPPHDLDAESAVIGACLNNTAAVRWAGEWLTPGDFYSPQVGDGVFGHGRPGQGGPQG